MVVLSIRRDRCQPLLDAPLHQVLPSWDLGDGFVAVPHPVVPHSDERGAPDNTLAHDPTQSIRLFVKKGRRCVDFAESEAAGEHDIRREELKMRGLGLAFPIQMQGKEQGMIEKLLRGLGRQKLEMRCRCFYEELSRQYYPVRLQYFLYCSPILIHQDGHRDSLHQV
jgi:hypothetical protein